VTVKELIAKLKKLDPKMKVAVYDATLDTFFDTEDVDVVTVIDTFPNSGAYVESSTRAGKDIVVLAV
jgi:copper chaperone CopZ